MVYQAKRLFSDYRLVVQSPALQHRVQQSNQILLPRRFVVADDLLCLAVDRLNVLLARFDQ
ncbi:hypothetical protein D3C85_1479980 [compost metagenome]